MSDSAPHPRVGTGTRTGRLASLLAVALAIYPSPSHGQDPSPLRLQGLIPGGLRPSVTESWGTLQFTVVNPNPTGREARVVVFYPEREDVQFARDVWVPGRAAVTSWVTVGPAPPQRGEFGREIRAVLYDRTGGANTLVLPPGDERVRSRSVPYRRREVTTAVLLDADDSLPGQVNTPDTASDVLTFARLARHEVGLSEHVSVVQAGPLPTNPEAFDGIDVLVVASDRLAADPPGRAAVRRWVEAGGRLWVMLDRTDPATVAPILGADFEVAAADRVSLTRVEIRRELVRATEPAREFEQPVPFVRVFPSSGDRVIASVDGWPAAFSRRLGRGTVLFTTLGPAAWGRPRGPRDGRPRYPMLPDLPVPVGVVSDLCTELHPTPEPDPLPPDAFGPLLTEEIGYSTIGRGTAGAILGGFFLVLLALGIGLRRSRRPGLVGTLAPVAAVLAAGIFVLIGERSRRAVPPSVGIAGVVDPVAGTGEVVVSGLYSVFTPTPGPVVIGTERGAELGLDETGLEGRTRTRVETDTVAWHWEGLSLPAGVRTGTFRETVRAGRVAAVVRFGPAGLEGRLETGEFRGAADAILSTPGHDPLAVSLGPDGAFRTSSENVLPAGQYVAGAVLTDRQQRRQEVYRRLLTAPPPRHLAGRDLLLAWADPAVLPVAAPEGTRVVGTVLLAVPLEFERTPPGTPVVVPRGFVPFRRVQGELVMPATTSAETPIDMRLRFQVPAAVLPMKVERATVFARVRVPARRFTVAGVSGGKAAPVFAADGPTEPIRVDVTDPALLQLDERGGLYFDVAVGRAPPGSGDPGWVIESLSLEVAGRTGE